MEGEVTFQVGEQRVQLHAGESVLAPRLVPHTFSSVGATPGRLLIAFCPAGKMERYFRDAENDKTSAGDAAFMRRSHKTGLSFSVLEVWSAELSLLPMCMANKIAL